MASDGVPKVFSLKEVEQHVAQDDCWMIIHGKVRFCFLFVAAWIDGGGGF